MEHRPVRTKAGGLLQSGIPKRPMINQPTKARGLQLKGVVMATYVLDAENHFQLDGRTGEDRKTAVGVYCDVLCYSNIAGMRWRTVPRCMVLQKAGIHDGDIWKPKATRLDITESSYNSDVASNPANFDGDHVKISFLNDNLNEPIIDGTIPHPSIDTGNEDSLYRRRIGLRVVDGDPKFWKHHGSYFGIDTDGNWGIDTRYANDGEYTDSGKEQAPPTASGDTKGSQAYQLPLQAEHYITLSDMAKALDQGEDEDGPKVHADMKFTKGERSINLPLTAAYSITLNDLVDPDNPDPKIKFTLDQTHQELEFVDSGLKVSTDDSGKTFKVDFNGGFNFLVDANNNKISLGGTSEKAVIDSAVQTELKSLRDAVAHLGHQLALHRHPPPEFPFPLLFGDIVATMKQPLIFLPQGTGAPINIRTGGEAKPDHAPMDAQAGVGEYVAAVNPPLWHPDFPQVGNIFDPPSDVGPTHSDTVDLEA